MKRFQTKKHIFNFIIALCLAVAISLCSCPAFDVLATDGEDYEEETEELSDEERAAQERKANIKITCMGKNYPETGSDAIVVMDAATGYDYHVAVFPDIKIVVYRFLDAAVAQHHRDVDAFFFRAGLYADVDAAYVGF